MAEIILEDSARINVSDTDRENRKRERAGLDLLEPLYEPQDAARLLALMQAVPYEEPFAVAPGITARLLEAGHMLGSTSIQLTVHEGGKRTVILFSGDLGPENLPIMRTAEPLENVDVVVMETTYGDRDHPPLEDTLAAGERIVLDAAAREGRILVPSFAIGRTQQIMYHMAGLFTSGRLEPFPVYVDSPMANEATEVYREHIYLFDKEATQRIESGRLARGLETIVPTSTVEQSRAINKAPNPSMVIASSGMCSGGRILHHLRHNLWRPDTTVLLVGYQAVGTLGRQLADGADTVRIFGEPIKVNAEIHQMGGLSAHAGQSDLLRWFDVTARSKPKVILTHGEERQRRTMAGLIKDRYGLSSILPFYGDQIEL
jgi:metallo-beta-lactamase family protein